jgi:endonuclease/exonuclease/phosphatase family metal-dependent hydrolase
MFRVAPPLAMFTSILFAAPSAFAIDYDKGDFTRDDPADIRVLTYNVATRFITDKTRDAAFARVLTAIRPDIICFQEIGPRTTDDKVAPRLAELLGGEWAIVKGKTSGVIRNIVAARFPLSLSRDDTDPPSSTRGVTIGLVDLPDDIYPADLYILGVHLQCCEGDDNIASRQRSADAIAAWIGDARQEAGRITLAPATPMLVLGDTNILSPENTEHTLLAGDIFDEETFGPDVKGDWDESDLLDSLPADPYTGDLETWPSDTTDPTERYDRFILTDSVITVANGFVLNTLNMTVDQLDTAGLQSGDTTNDETSDHLPVVIDLRFPPPPRRGDTTCDGAINFEDIDPFVVALVSIEQYQAEFPNCDWRTADIDGDGDVDFEDIDPFVECIVNGGCD